MNKSNRRNNSNYDRRKEKNFTPFSYGESSNRNKKWKWSKMNKRKKDKSREIYNYERRNNIYQYNDNDCQIISEIHTMTTSIEDDPQFKNFNFMNYDTVKYHGCPQQGTFPNKKELERNRILLKRQMIKEERKERKLKQKKLETELQKKYEKKNGYMSYYELMNPYAKNEDDNVDGELEELQKQSLNTRSALLELLQEGGLDLSDGEVIDAENALNLDKEYNDDNVTSVEDEIPKKLKLTKEQRKKLKRQKMRSRRKNKKKQAEKQKAEKRTVNYEKKFKENDDLESKSASEIWNHFTPITPPYAKSKINGKNTVENQSNRICQFNTEINGKNTVENQSSKICQFNTEINGKNTVENQSSKICQFSTKISTDIKPDIRIQKPKVELDPDFPFIV